MFPFQSQAHGSGQDYWTRHPNGFVHHQEPGCWPVTLTNGGDSIVSSSSTSSVSFKAEKKSTSEACKSHKEAERRRRQRINAHLSTLRSLLPNTIKTDKASLLGEVVHHVKALRKQADDVSGRDCSSSSSWTGSGKESWPFPKELDELTLTPYCDNGTKVRRQQLIKATLSCEDRPGLHRDLDRAIASVPARPVRAETMTVGGRTKSELVVEWLGGGGNEEDVAVLQRALTHVMNNRASNYALVRNGPATKRTRVGGLIDDYELDGAFGTSV